MSFFDFSNMRGAGECLLATIAICTWVFFLVVEPLEPRTRRLGIRLSVLTSILMFGAQLVADFPSDGRGLRFCLGEALLFGLLVAPLAWTAKETAWTAKDTTIACWQDGKALVARIRRWSKRLQHSREKGSGNIRPDTGDGRPLDDSTLNRRDEHFPS